MSKRKNEKFSLIPKECPFCEGRIKRGTCTSCNRKFEKAATQKEIYGLRK